MRTCAAQAVAEARGTSGPAGPPAVVAVGGDGTVHTVLQSVAGSGVPLGVVAAGSGDDAARAWGLPLDDPTAAAHRLMTGQPCPIDLGHATDATGQQRWFATVAATGFDARVAERSLSLGGLPASVRYLVALGAELGSFRPRHYRMTLDGEPRDVDGMLVAVGVTSHYGGGMAICPSADPTDGRFDVLVLAPVPLVRFLLVFPRVYRGTHLSHPAVSLHHARSVTLDTDDVVAVVDGERLGPLPVTLRIRPAAITVLGAQPARRRDTPREMMSP